MHIDNRGAIAAILIVAGIDLPPSFNLDQGAFDRAMEARKLERPHFDADALRFLATFDAAKDFANTLAQKKEEVKAALGEGATPEKINAFDNIKKRKLEQLRQAKQAEDEKSVQDAAEKAAEEEFERELNPPVPTPSTQTGDNKEPEGSGLAEGAKSTAP